MNVKKVTRRKTILKAEKRGRRILCGAALLLLIGGVWGAQIAGNRADKQMRQDLLLEAVNIAAAIPADQAVKLTFTKQDADRPEFQRMAACLRTFAENQTIRSLYTMGLRDKKIFFGPESLSTDDPYASPPGTRYKQPSPPDFEIFQDAQPVVQGPFSDEYGTFVSASAPVINPRTGEVILVVGCDMEASAWSQTVRKAQWAMFFLAEIPLLIMIVGWGMIRFRQSKAPEQGRKLRHIEAFTCSIVLLLLTLGGSAVLHHTNAAARQRIFTSMAQLKADSLSAEIKNFSATLDGLVALFESSESVSANEFDTFCNQFISRHAVRGYRWIPEVYADKKTDFEKQTRQVPGFENFSIWNRDPNNRPVPATNRPVYYPALYVSPIEGYRHFVGFDLLSDPTRSNSIQQALQTELTTASLPSRPVSNSEDSPGIFICKPAQSGEQRGLVSLFFHPDVLVQDASRFSAAGETTLHADIINLPSDTLPESNPAASGKLNLTTPVFMFGQTFAIVITPSKEWLAAHPLTQGKIALGAGLILMVLGTSLVSILSSRPALLEEMVHRRTRELLSSEQYNRAIFDSTNDAIFVHDAKTMTIVDFNGAAEIMFGMSRSELFKITVETISEGIAPYTQTEAAHRMKEARAGRPQVFDWRSKHADGSLFWTEVSLHSADIGSDQYIIAVVRNVESRRRVEEAIRRSEQRFELAAQAGETGIWDLNLATGHLSWDGRMHKIYGTQPGEFGSNDQTWQQAVHPDDLARASAEMKAAQQDGVEFNTEFRIVRPNGEIRHIHASAVVTRDTDGTPLRMIGTNQDITERKTAKAQLELTQFAVDNLGDAAYWADEGGHLIYVNAAACQALRYKEEELLDMYVWDIDPNVTQTTWQDAVEDYQKRTNTILECSHRRKDGSTFPVEMKVNYIEFGNTKIVCSFAHDITRRKEARQALEESRHFLRTVIDTIPDRVWWKDLHSAFLGCNLNFARDAGLESPKELIGKTDYDMCWKDEADHFVADDREVIESNHPKLGIQEFQTQADGNTRWIETNKIPLKDQTGQVIGTVGTYADITERKEAETRLRESAQRLRSHIENTPLAAIEWDMDWNVTAWNSSAEHIFGYTAEQIVGKHVSVLVPELDWKQVDDHLSGIHLKKAGTQATNHNLTRDGKVILCDWYNSILTDENGHLTGVASLAMDITQAEENKQALEQSEENLRTTLHSIGDAVIATDTQKRIVMMNPVAEKLTGWTFENSAGKPADQIFRIINEQTRKTVRSPITEVLETGGLVELANHTILQSQSGEEIPIADSGAPIRDAEGETTGVVLVFRDQTREHRARKQLEESEARYRNLFDNMTSGFAVHEMIYDPDGNPADYRFLQVNPAYERLTGLSADQIIEKTVKEVLPEIESYWIETFGRVAQTGEPATFENYSKDLDKYFGTRAFCPAPGQFAVVFSDITERVRLQEALERRIIALTQPLKSVDKIAIEELFDLNELQKIQDGFSTATGVASVITHPDGTPITKPSNLTRLCRDVIRKTEKGCANCLKSDASLGRHNLDGPIVQCCLSGGLWDAGTSITVGGRHIASWLIGQVRDETQTEEKMLAYAREIGADEQQTLEAFREVPAMSRERFDHIAQALFTLAEQLSNTAYQNMQQARFISEQKKAEEALRESQEYLEKMWRSMDVGIVLIDAETRRIIRANPAVLNMSGYSANELEDQRCHNLLCPEDEGNCPVGDQGRNVDRSERKLVHKDGHMVDVEKSVTSITLEGREVYLETLADITERKQAQEKLLRLSTAIEQSPESVIMTDPDGMIRYVNPAFEAVTGYRAEETIGLNSNVLKSGQEPDAFYDDLRKTLAQGDVWTGRLSCKRKSGVIRTEEAVISPVKNPVGEITHFVSVQRDITDELARENQLQQAQKMEAVGQLAGGIAHDFNNILQAILGFSELLLVTIGEKDESSRSSVLEIQKAGRHAADLTRQLLTFSRKQPAEFGPLNLNHVLQESETILSSILGENVRLRNELQQNLVTISADRRQIERIIINLSINARDAMPQGGDLTLRTTNTTFTPEDAATMPKARAGTFACLSVSDTGTGMSRETLDRIFEPFFSTKAPGKGTGLGLASIYGIVQEHNGWISVYSEPGQGSTFKVYLPALESDHADKPSQQETTEKPQHGSGHILVVEDDPSVRNLSKTALEKAGYRVTIAECTEEAEELFEQSDGRFDLIFSDVILPGKNGADFAAAILDKHPNLPVLLCSGYSGERIRNAGIDKQGVHFLEKPFSIVHLLKTVTQILSAKR